MTEIKVLLDLNIILDVVGKREPHYLHSALVWKMIEKKEIEGYVSAHSFTTLHYLLRKHMGKREVNQAISNVMQVFSAAPVTHNILLQALILDWEDFEDAVQFVAAAQVNAGYLITRNVKDYKSSHLEILTPETFIKVFALR
ncbi:MAG: PIN domain-containing protein [Anaerolineaceae bacterium]|nr:PIN domain-containing protein [Anaerolineaceae bacterium]